MDIKTLIQTHQQRLTETYGHRLLPSHRKALDAMLACHSHCGEYLVHCESCLACDRMPLSCGHRSCPQCQHHLGEAWYERQSQKLLPVTYFMVTFTIPKSLRTVAWQHQAIFYDLLFKAASETLNTIGKNNHGMRMGMTGVLHTHTRQKDFHPHIHMIVPGGGFIIDPQGAAWKPLSEKYLVNEFALAKVFRGILFRLLYEQAIALPPLEMAGGTPKQWVAHVRNIGKGNKALRYLSRYLYRGVISEKDILADTHGQVTFRYKESKTNCLKTLQLPAEDFLWRLLKHVLPRGFRRVRDYGFLHGNAKVLLQRIQLLLRVKLPNKKPRKKDMACRHCESPAKIVFVDPWKIPYRFRVPVESDVALTST